MNEQPVTVDLALLSHTNAGKTTLARTLLRKDIGAVMDRAHVTEVAESHVLIETAAGDRLVLWDTPGFGDSVRLLRRLERSGNPLGWFLTQVWDRFADRPFWCGQQALRAARDASDVVLYVANATEDPASAAYVEPELRIVAWLGKPALVLLNQLGTAATPGQDAEEAARWQEAVNVHGGDNARLVLPFDAFARCWLQEHALLAAIRTLLPAPTQAGFDRLTEAWRARDRRVLGDSAAIIARQMARLAADVEHVNVVNLADRARQWLGTSGGQGDASPAERRAQNAMSQRLESAVRASTAEIVALHGLSGDAGAAILQLYGHEFSIDRAPDADKAGVLGGLVSGALAGVAADLASGGLTFGAGALLGGIAGAVGARSLTRHYNAQRGANGSDVRWSDAYLQQRLVAALLRYLAVAHFGRGRGEFVNGDVPAHWRDAVTTVLARREDELSRTWTRLREGEDTAGAAATTSLVRAMLWETLEALYPEAARTFEAGSVARALNRD
jgi:hypothetical protein